MKAQINTEYIHDKCINDLCYSSNGKYVIIIAIIITMIIMIIMANIIYELI